MNQLLYNLKGINKVKTIDIASHLNKHKTKIANPRSNVDSNFKLPSIIDNNSKNRKKDNSNANKQIRSISSNHGLNLKSDDRNKEKSELPLSDKCLININIGLVSSIKDKTNGIIKILSPSIEIMNNDKKLLIIEEIPCKKSKINYFHV